MANARRITCNTGWQATVDRTLLIGHLPPLDDWREADEESTAISNNSTSKAAWTGNRQARTTMLVPLLGWRQCQTIRTPQEDPCRPANRRRPPTAPPIRPGIAVGVVAVGNPARVALRHLYRAQRAARPIRIAPIACRPLPRAHCAYRTLPASPSALRPSHAARTHPSCCGYHGALAGKNRAACIPFSPSARKRPLPGNICAKCMLLEIKMARSSPYASISRRNRAIRDAWRANLAIKGPFSRRGPRNHTWREDVASAARPFAAPRREPRARELAEQALLPAAWAWPACRICGSLPSRPPHSIARIAPTGPACITLAALSVPIVATRIAHRSRGGVSRRSGARAAPSSFAPAPTTCASRCPRRRPHPPSASRTAANERNCAASSMWA